MFFVSGFLGTTMKQSMQSFYRFVCTLCLATVYFTRLTNAFHVVNSHTSFYRLLRSHQVPTTNVKMTYEIVDSISPLLATQLATCASIVTAGTVVGNGKKEIESFEDEYDVFRDSILRYAGYLNEIGEAFRPLVPSEVVVLSYILTISYIVADAGWKAREYKRKNSDLYNGGFNFGGPIAAVDTLLFQLIASVIFPGFIINRWVTLVAYLTYEQLKLPDLVSSMDLEPFSIGSIHVVPSALVFDIPTALGLLLIPFIVKPLDELTEYALDTTVRPFFMRRFPGCEFPFRAVEAVEERDKD